MEFKNLPIEIKSKIMYSGFIKHPITNLFNYFLNDIIPLNSDISNPSFIEHLINIGELRNNMLYFWCKNCNNFHFLIIML